MMSCKHILRYQRPNSSHRMSSAIRRPCGVKCLLILIAHDSKRFDDSRQCPLMSMGCPRCIWLVQCIDGHGVDIPDGYSLSAFSSSGLTPQRSSRTKFELSVRVKNAPTLRIANPQKKSRHGQQLRAQYVPFTFSSYRMFIRSLRTTPVQRLDDRAFT